MTKNIKTQEICDALDKLLDEIDRVVKEEGLKAAIPCMLHER